MLYAYNESPLLKAEINYGNFRNIFSKKMINFDQIEKEPPK